MPLRFQEYKALLKDTAAEEILHLYFFRPLAFPLVKLIYRFPITPNQLSFLSISAGILSGIFFALGNKSNFICAGLLLGLTQILDCCDGMIARLKKSGTPTGRIIDGLTDYINGFAAYIGFGIGLSRADIEFPISPLLLVLFSGMCLILHSIVVDYYRNEFMAHALGKARSTQEDIEFFSSELEKLKQHEGKFMDKLLIKAYLKYSRIQVRKPPRKKIYDPKTYYRANRLLVRLWNSLGASTHIFILMISSFLYKPSIFFFFTLGVANIGVLCLLVIQVKRNKEIVIKDFVSDTV